MKRTVTKRRKLWDSTKLFFRPRICMSSCSPLTSAWPPAFKVFLHFSHFRHGRCQSFPREVTFSAMIILEGRGENKKIKSFSHSSNPSCISVNNKTSYLIASKMNEYVLKDGAYWVGVVWKEYELIIIKTQLDSEQVKKKTYSWC